MGAGVEPASVGLFSLITQRKGDAEAAAVDFLDLPHQPLHPVDEPGIAALSALQSDRSVAEILGEPGAREDLFITEDIAGDFPVTSAKPAVETVLLADVSEFDKTAEMDVIVQVCELHFEPAANEILLLLPFRGEQLLDSVEVELFHTLQS